MMPATLDKVFVPAISICVHTVGAVLVITSGLMFFKHGCLRKMDNFFVMGMLVSYAIFLVADWSVWGRSAKGCEMFSVTFLLFGSLGTWFTVCIAAERNKKMAKVLFVLISRKHYLVCFCLAVGLSLVTVICPIYIKTHTREHQSLPLDVTAVDEVRRRSADIVCLYSDGLLYQTTFISVTSAIMSVLVPVCLMTFCYVNIYKNLRRARINRLFNQAAARCNRITATVRPSNRRRINVFQIRPESQHLDTSNEQLSSNTKRELSVLRKGLLSVSIILICWLPFSSFWIYLSFNGFTKEDSIRQHYLILLSKASVICNIAHHVCLNVKYKKLYRNTVRGPFESCAVCAPSGIYPEDNTSQLDSNTVASCNLSTIYTLTAVGRPTLEPIYEHPVDTRRKSTFDTNQADPGRLRAPSVHSLPAQFQMRRCGLIPSQVPSHMSLKSSQCTRG